MRRILVFLFLILLLNGCVEKEISEDTGDEAVDNLGNEIDNVNDIEEELADEDLGNLDNDLDNLDW